MFTQFLFAAGVFWREQYIKRQRAVPQIPTLKCGFMPTGGRV